MTKDKELTGETYRFFLYLLSTLNFENWILTIRVVTLGKDT